MTIAKCPVCGETKNILHCGDIINSLIKCRCLVCHPTSNIDNIPDSMIGPLKSKCEIYWPFYYWEEPGITEWHSQDGTKVLIGNTFVDPTEAARKREADRLEQHHD